MHQNIYVHCLFVFANYFNFICRNIERGQRDQETKTFEL